MTLSVTVNGTNLDNQLAQGVTGVTGLHHIPAKRGANIQIPERDGELHVPGKLYGPGTVVLPLWVRGVNPVDESVVSDTAARLLFHQRARDLAALFCVGDLVTVRHTLSDGTAREVTGEATDAIPFDVTSTDRWTLGQVTIGLTCADPFWADVVDTTADFTATTGSATSLTGFTQASARMNNLVVTFWPASNPRLTQPASGALLAYNGVIGAGRKLVVDTGAWSVTGTVDAGGTWLPTSPPLQHIARVEKGPHARLFTLSPERPAAPVVVLTHTGGGTARVTVTGRQRHLVA